ncbi:MAG: DUF4215 domain-containing protein [Kofleriaceae bacterium]|nr:DUF4215 domain-containing protein [Kofleriaceae bacterium]MBP6837958.1 DUF4215 domain-containing protein [Kofleriaceae bacterium]MBP9207855.1 DUF4215 domain-containing protein [Kofleriaceae bacterium]
MRCPRPLFALLGLTLAMLTARPAAAALHLMKVVEVFPGATSAPSAQYVVLQMYAAGQTVVGGASVVVYSGANLEVGRFTFGANVSGGANQAKILVATSQAQALFGLSADLTMSAVLPLTGGKVCFEAAGFGALDCVAWGDHPGSAPGGGGGNVGAPLAPVLGLRHGRALLRRLDLAGGATTLDAGDDSNDCATDLRFGPPQPRNNAGQNGTTPPSTCGNTTIEGLESCDDGNPTGDDGCDAGCLDEACGDGVDNDGSETCDDGNLVAGDGCDPTCRVTGCGSGVVTAGESCDDGNLVSADGCDANCTPTGCGNGVVTAGEVCDDGDLTSGDGCDGNCTPTGCGNGIVTAGEACEPPGTASCDASCQALCAGPADCADLDPCTSNERCLPGGCAVDPTPTDDDQPCTADGCDASGVFHQPLADGVTCTLAGDPGRALCVAGACGLARCGDGFVDTGAPGGPEPCDDGNLDDTDACTTTCQLPRCGDGFVQAGEACDDGNLVDTDACISCIAARCGDEFVGPGETCDDGNQVSGDGCSFQCVAEFCGDGIAQLGEACDDGNPAAGDGCSPACEVEAGPGPGGDDGAGCCRTSGDAGGAAGLLALAVLGLGRRRRR